MFYCLKFSTGLKEWLSFIRMDWFWISCGYDDNSCEAFEMRIKLKPFSIDTFRLVNWRVTTSWAAKRSQPRRWSSARRKSGTLSRVNRASAPTRSWSSWWSLTKSTCSTTSAGQYWRRWWRVPSAWWSRRRRKCVLLVSAPPSPIMKTWLLSCASDPAGSSSLIIASGPCPSSSSMSVSPRRKPSNVIRYPLHHSRLAHGLKDFKWLQWVMEV